MVHARSLLAAVALAGAPLCGLAATSSVLFVGNSYTFGRVNPVMGYNTANVRDLTDIPGTGGNAFEPHPWGGVPGIFKQFTVQAGLDVDVALSTRNAASLRGHLLNTNGVVDLRSNLSSQTWTQVVLQEQSDEPLAKRAGLGSNPDWFNAYANKLEDFVHLGAATSYYERDLFAGATEAARTAACRAATGASATTCNTLRNIPANPNASAATQLCLAYANAAALAGADGSGGFAGIAPVGESFLRAVTSGVATRNMWAASAATDGLIDLWFDDGTHASTYGSYLSALTLFGTLTGLDPASLGAAEVAAADLGISRADALALQRVASDQLGFAAPVPEPATAALWALGLLAGLGRLARQRRQAVTLAGAA